MINVQSAAELDSQFSDVEIGVVSALRIEMDALIPICAKHEKIFALNRVYDKFYFETTGKVFAIVGYTSDRMGIPSMAITLMELIQNFPRLKYIGLIGIAAGSDSSDQKFGDVLVPKLVFNYELGKYLEDETGHVSFEGDYSSFRIEDDILQKIQAVLADPKTLTGILNKTVPRKKDPINFYSGEFACGSAVIASKNKIKEIETAISRKYIGLDMESYAVASVNGVKVNPYPKMFIIKAISDFADRKKDDKAQDYARYVSASAFIEVCSVAFDSQPLNSSARNSDMAETSKKTGQQELDRYKSLAKQFDEIRIENREDRVAEKERIGKELAEFILEKNLEKQDILKLYSEGAFAGLVMSMLLRPEENDKAIIFEHFDRASQPFTKHKILEVIRKLSAKDFLEKKDLSQIKKVNELFSFGADESLIRKMKETAERADRKFIIKIYAEDSDHFKLSKILKVVQGDPRIVRVSDNVFPLALKFEGEFTQNATDILTDPNGRQVSEIEFAFLDIKDYKVYVHVRCRSVITDQIHEVWVSFSNELIPISRAPGAGEKAFPVIAKELYLGWKQVTVDMNDCVQQLFGVDHLEYITLLNMRVRGSGKLAYIILR